MQAAHQPLHLCHQAQIGNFYMNMVVAGFPFELALQPQGLAFIAYHQGQLRAQLREPMGRRQAYARIRAGDDDVFVDH